MVKGINKVSKFGDPSLDRHHLLCFGYGYSAKCLSQNLIKRGWTVTATSRSGSGISVDGVQLIDFENFDAEIVNSVTHIMVSTPPDFEGDPVLSRYTGLIKSLSNIHWIGYLSTTGVYGDTDGALVDECSTLNPTNNRSKYRINAERLWLELNHSEGLPIHIFRLAGIYGVGRNVLKQVLAGKAQRIELPGHKFSRIHVEDIARVLIASIRKCEPGEIYNVCDDEPASQSDVMAFACEILNVELPKPIRFEEAIASMSPMAKSFWRDNRRVDNAKMKRNLGVSLLYPTYKAGLRAIVENDIG